MPALITLLALLAATLVSAPAHAQKVRVTMISSATEVAVGDPFVVEIRADLAGDDVDDIALPDFGKLEVLGRRVSRPMSFSFGFGTGGQHAQVVSQIVHGFTLRATQPGNYVIQPAIVTVGGRKYASPKLSIVARGQALPNAPDPNAGQGIFDPQGGGQPEPKGIAPPDGPLSGARYDPELFLRTVVDKPKAQLGEQVTITVYLYVYGGLSQNPSVTREPTTEGFWVQDLLPVQRTLAPVRQEINGRTYNVYVLRRFAAFALRTGALKVGAPAIEIASGPSLFDLITGPTQTIRRNGVEVPIEALPLPDHAGKGPTHVGTLTLESSLDPREAKVGDAVTLRVVAKGQGNLKALKLADPKLDGVDVLAPEIEDKVTTDLDVVGGERTFRWLLLPRQPGTLALSPFAVNVFDPQSKQYSQARSDGFSLHVKGGLSAGVNAAKSPDEPRAPSARESAEPARSFGAVRADAELARAAPRLLTRPWYGWAVSALPLTCLMVWLGSAVLRSFRTRRAGSPGEQALRAAELKLKEAEQCAQAGDAPKAYAALFSGLRSALSARLHEPVGGLTLSQLQKHCIERGMAAGLAGRIVVTLAAAEQARFDPSQQSEQSFAAHLRASQELVREIARFSSKEAA